MRKALIFNLGFLLAGCLPAAAQYHFAAVNFVETPAQWHPAPFSHEAFTGETARAEFATLQPAADSRQRTGFSAKIFLTEPERPATLEASFRYAETPFAQQVQVPVVRLLGGRLTIHCFDTLQSSENELLGPPVNQPAWSVATQAHPGLSVPAFDESVGLSLDIRLNARTPDDQSVALLHCLGKLVGAGRRCRLM